MVNITGLITPLMTESEVLKACYELVTKNSLIFIFVLAILLYPISIFSVVGTKNLNIGKILLSWLFFIILLGLVFVFAFISPNGMQSLFNFFS